MIERREQCLAFLPRAQTVEPHRVQPLENVPALPVPGRVTVLLEEPLYLLEARDDAFLAGRTAALLVRLRELVELRAQLIKVEVTHSGPHP